MKILITAGIFPPEIGGPATYVPRIAEALVNRGHQVTIVAPKIKGVPCPIENPVYRIVFFHRVSFIRYVNFLIEIWRSFWVIFLEAKKCDLIFNNGLGISPVIVSLLLAKPMVTKVVGDKVWEWSYTRGWTQKDLDSFQSITNYRLRLLRWYHHASVRTAKIIITPSHYLARIVSLWGISKENIRVIYNAFDPPEQHQNESNLLILPNEFRSGFRLITIGRLVPHKRISGIIDAIKPIGDVKLIIVGDGVLRAELEAYVKGLSLTDRVYFTGILPQRNIWALLSLYGDGLVLNSIYEGLPHVLLEAAYFGVPIIATAVGGTVEFVKDMWTGLLVDPGFPEELISAIQRVQNDKDLRKFIVENAKYQLDEFSFNRQVVETESILEEAARCAF